MTPEQERAPMQGLAEWLRGMAGPLRYANLAAPQILRAWATEVEQARAQMAQESVVTDLDALRKMLQDALAQAAQPAEAQPVATMTLVSGKFANGRELPGHGLPDGVHLLYAAPPAQPMTDALQLVNAQAEDAGLWFNAQTAPEAYLQQALRRLHAAVERDTKGAA